MIAAPATQDSDWCVATHPTDTTPQPVPTYAMAVSVNRSRWAVHVRTAFADTIVSAVSVPRHVLWPPHATHVPSRSTVWCPTAATFHIYYVT